MELEPFTKSTESQMTMEPNRFDNLVVDVPSLYRDTSASSQRGSMFAGQAIFHKIYRFPLFPLPLRIYLWHLFRRTQLDWNWFERFRHYWTQVLGGRPLWAPQDLYFLRNLYRIKFQRLESGNMGTTSGHLSAWQQPSVLYQLLHLVFRESIGNEIKFWQLAHKHAHGPFESVLEYGCATAPVMTTYYEFFGRPRFKVQLSDIQTLAFHYASYKFNRFEEVAIKPLVPENNFQLAPNSRFDLIFCITVFEHLNDPLETIKRFHAALAPGGLLFFDYILSEAKGLDTASGLEARASVLDFIKENFEVLEGKIDYNETMNLTVVRRVSRG